ncbi:MAG: polynucleotide adenylyltransferase PcnB, partial [Erysipelotrichia bacterium]|nr:polynucleotide adenylyltransferase PcnB [Erysipelotrichia bacterium]
NILIRTIGNPAKRLREEPLRILRAIRFSLVLDFEIEESLVFAINKYGSKLSEIKNEKIKEEIKKMKDAGVSIYDIRSEFKKFNVLPGLKI